MPKINVNAALFARAAKVQSTEETRYYLNGVSVEPDPKGGAVLVATDGHKLVAIHDPSGECDAPVIVFADKETLKACNAPRNAVSRRLTLDEADDIRITEPAAPGETFTVRTQHRGRVDGHFPAWRKVVPLALTEQPLHPVFNPRHILPLAGALACDSKESSLRLFGTGDAQDPIIVAGSDPINAFAILMPMRGGAEKPAHLWWEVSGEERDIREKAKERSAAEA